MSQLRPDTSFRTTLALLLTACLCHCGEQPSTNPLSDETAQAPPVTGDMYLDVTTSVGIRFQHHLPDGHLSNLVEGLGSGAAMADFDGDGFLDLLFLNFAPHDSLSPGEAGPEQEPALYRNTGRGTFSRVAHDTGLKGSDFSIAAAVADHDNDGDPDVYVVNAGVNRLYRNEGGFTFREVADDAGVADPGLGASATFLDMDRDGWLDLYVGNYLHFDPEYSLHYQPDAFPGPIAYEAQTSRLYRNRGDGTFEDVTDASGVGALDGRDMSAVAADLDDDGDDDLFLAIDATGNFLLLNDGQGHFQDLGAERGVAYGLRGEYTASMAADVADLDGDGRLDLAVSDIGFGGLYMAMNPGQYDDRVFASGLASIFGQFVGWGQCLLDYDNDGDMDLFRVNGDMHHVVGWEDLLVRNDGQGVFQDVSADSGAYFQRKECSRGACVGDYDNDGDMDILITCLDGAPILLRNDRPTDGNWLRLRLQGTRSNRDGFGALVRVTAASHAQLKVNRCPTGYLSAGDPRLHFGVGGATRIDQVRVQWPSGVVQVIEDVASNQELVLTEPADTGAAGGGSP